MIFSFSIPSSRDSLNPPKNSTNLTPRSDIEGKKLWSAYLATLFGSLITFFFGVLVLSFFVPATGLFMAGVIPFLPGDLVKSVLSSGIAVSINKKMRLKL